ncbi:C40 family peptidase [Flexivirga alba]|uniref:C40 family peptidase n=1 Tax=Flexivirga alba TaxID=702742 RepID=A0ABW2AIW7_9MICO
MTSHAGAAAAAAAVVFAGGGILGLSTVAAAGQQPSAVGPVCAGSGPIAGLQPDQAQNAHLLVAVAESRGGDRAALIAVMVALAESGLRVLDHGDHDSLGLFQQRANWGTAVQRMDPTTSTNLFLNALLNVPSWAGMTPWQAGQAVQKSAWNGRPTSANGWSSVVGGNYLKVLGRANTILDAAKRTTAHLDCGGQTGGKAPPNGGSFGLPVGFTLPAGTSAPATSAVTTALAQLGKPYVWAASGPNAYDCSGLTSASWATAGVQLGRTTKQQVNDGVPTDVAQLLPGDLILTPGSYGTLASPGHVGMYIGRALVVEAPHPGGVVHVVTFSSFVAGGLSAMRHIE